MGHLRVMLEEHTVGKGSSIELVGLMIPDHKMYIFKETQPQAAVASELGRGACHRSYILTLTLHKVGNSLVAVAFHSECLSDGILSVLWLYM